MHAGRILGTHGASWAHAGRIPGFLSAKWTQAGRIPGTLGTCLAHPGHPGGTSWLPLGAQMGTMPKPPSRKRTAQHNEPTFGVPRCTAQAPQRDLKPQMQFRVDETAARRGGAGHAPRTRLCQWGPGNSRDNGNPTLRFGDTKSTLISHRHATAYLRKQRGPYASLSSVGLWFGSSQFRLWFAVVRFGAVYLSSIPTRSDACFEVLPELSPDCSYIISYYFSEHYS